MALGILALAVTAAVLLPAWKLRRPIRWVIRFLLGEPLGGKHHTDATFFQHPTKVLHPRGRVSWWHWRPGWHRGFARVTAVLLVAGILAGLFLEPAAVENSAAAVLAVAVGLVTWWFGRAVLRWKRATTWDRDHPWKSLGSALALPWMHHLWFRKPLRAALTSELSVPPSKVKVALDRSTVKIGLPPDFTGTDTERAAVERSVTTKLAIEAPEATYKLHGRKPYVVFVQADPPPGFVSWDDVAAIIRNLGPDDLLTGIGKRGKPVSVSLKLDSPHFGISMGTGGGKSTLAAFWLVQELMRGSIVLILDAKRFSHPWAFKDMDAEYGLLPNVAYCRTVTDLHNAMIWLGVELDRRNAVAERTIDARGTVHGDVGPRIWIVAEELNLAVPMLKQHWAQIRDKEDPKRSPALAGIGAVSFAGRAVRMHEVVIGQQLKAEVLGGGDVRENIGVRCMARYTANSWKMQAGDIPMPPSPSVPGRVQVLASAEVHEAQVPLVDFGLIRELAISGTVTTCPAGMPGRLDAPHVPVLGHYTDYEASDLPVVLGQPPALTLSQAVAEGVFGDRNLEAVRKIVQRAPEPLEVVGKDGSAHLFRQADLLALARRTEK